MTWRWATLPLLEVLEMPRSADVEARIRSAATTIYQALIEAGLTAVIGAERHERSGARTALVKARRAGTGISKSEASRICAEFDVEVAAFRDRSLADQPFR